MNRMKMSLKPCVACDKDYDAKLLHNGVCEKCLAIKIAVSEASILLHLKSISDSIFYLINYQFEAKCSYA